MTFSMPFSRIGRDASNSTSSSPPYSCHTAKVPPVARRDSASESQ
jgi:hypothetical protein